MSTVKDDNKDSVWIVDKIDDHKWNKYKKCWMFNTSFKRYRYDLTDPIMRKKVEQFKKEKEIADSYQTKNKKAIYIKFKNKWLYEKDFVNDILLTNYKMTHNLK